MPYIFNWSTETGIVCLDEFDKIAKPKSPHGSKDISGEVLPLMIPRRNARQSDKFATRVFNKPSSR